MACCFIFMVLVSGLPVFPGLPACSFSLVFRFARFPGFPACSFSRASGLLAFSGFRLARFFWFPACPFSRVPGLSVFPGFRFAGFFGFPVCPFSRVFRFACFFGFSGLFSDFPVFSRAFRSFFCFVSRIFPFFVLYLQGGCSVLSVRKEIHKSSARIASR